MDEHKGWFDYSSCCLGVCAWDLALAGACYSGWASRGNADYFMFVYGIVVALIAAFIAIFLHWRLSVMTKDLSPIVRNFFPREGCLASIAAWLWLFWEKIGHQIFVTMVAIYWVILAISRYSAS